jgi:uncharacterized membrane protein
MNDDAPQVVAADSSAVTPAHPAGAVEVVISRLLQVGVVTSMLLVAGGTVVSFAHHPDYLTDPPALARLTRPGAAFPHTLADVARGVRAGRGRAMVTVGLLLLIATPVVRVAVSVVAFALERDARYVVITTVVLGLLFLSFFLGTVER